MIKIRKQHYVKQEYLKNWSDNSTQIYVLFKDSKKIIKTTTINIAQKRDFYTIEKITEDEYNYLINSLNSMINNDKYKKEWLISSFNCVIIPLLMQTYRDDYLNFKKEIIKNTEIIEKIINSKIDINFIMDDIYENTIIITNELNKIFEIFNSLYNLSEKCDSLIYSEFRKNIENYLNIKNQFIIFLKRLPIENMDLKGMFISFDNPIETEQFNIFIHNLGEEYQSINENVGYSYLDKLLKDDISFLSDYESKINFLTYLLTQYFRTNKSNSNIVKNFKNETEGMNIENIWKILQYPCGVNSAINLSITPIYYCLLKSESIHFLTCDQPVINLKKDERSEDNSVLFLELYYPISPYTAIKISSDIKYIKQIEVISDKQIDEFNQFMVDNCENQVYSDDEQLLKKYFQEAKINN